MQNHSRAVSLDASEVRFHTEREVDSAIDTVVTFAFGAAEPIDRYLGPVHCALPARPTVKELVDAVFRVREGHGPIPEERARRERAAMAMAAFLSADPVELGLPSAMFRVGAEVWLTPARSTSS